MKENHNRTQLSSGSSHCRHLLHQRAGRSLPFPATSRGTHKQVSGVHPLPGRLLPLRWLTSIYDSFSKGTITTRDHIYVASAALWLINSEPCMAGGTTHLAGRHPRPFLALSPASGGCALWKKASLPRVAARFD